MLNLFPIQISNWLNKAFDVIKMLQVFDRRNLCLVKWITKDSNQREEGRSGWLQWKIPWKKYEWTKGSGESGKRSNRTGRDIEPRQLQSVSAFSSLLCHSYRCPAFTWTQRAFSAKMIQVPKGKGFGLAERLDQTDFDQNSAQKWGRQFCSSIQFVRWCILCAQPFWEWYKC